MEVQYINSSYPYNSAGSFMEYFEGLTYQHVNFIFDGASHFQESAYPSMTTSFYKFGLSDFGNNISYYDHSPSYDGSNHEPCPEEYRRASVNSPSMSNEETVAMNVEWEGNANSTSRENPVDCKLSVLPLMMSIMFCLFSKMDCSFTFEVSFPPLDHEVKCSPLYHQSGLKVIIKP
ncbi:hypothetical protein Gohar_006138, partial [Gossypium harknessii]|nr:hypothetical protein [Gossypium harknessii]